jgi:hypothetical protein
MVVVATTAGILASWWLPKPAKVWLNGWLAEHDW